MKKIFNLYKTAYTKLFECLSDWFGEEYYKAIGAMFFIVALASSSIIIPITQMKSLWAAPVVILIQVILYPIYYVVIKYVDKKL